MVFSSELTPACLCPGCPLLPGPNGQLPTAAQRPALVPPHGAGRGPSNGKAATKRCLGQTTASSSSIPGRIQHLEFAFAPFSRDGNWGML